MEDWADFAGKDIEFVCKWLVDIAIFFPEMANTLGVWALLELTDT
jgi:hypothetical protein